MVLLYVNGPYGPYDRDVSRKVSSGKGECHGTEVEGEERTKGEEFGRETRLICAWIGTKSFKGGDIYEHDEPSVDKGDGILDEY